MSDLCRAAAPFCEGEDESQGRRVQLGCRPHAIKLNCLTLLPLPPPPSKSKGLNSCQAAAANEAERDSGMFSAPAGVAEESEVRGGGLHQRGPAKSHNQL